MTPRFQFLLALLAATLFAAITTADSHASFQLADGRVVTGSVVSSEDGHIELDSGVVLSAADVRAVRGS